MGSDPEFMLQTPNGNFVSAIGIVPGDKYARHRIDPHEFYYDNVMAECAVSPASSKEEMVVNFRDCFQKFSNLIHPFELVPRASQNYPMSELQHDDAKAIGCDPEYCVYSLTNAVPPTAEFQTGTLRTAGGHVHLGAEIAQDEFGSIFTIRMLDLFLGIPSIYIDPDKTTKQRKKLYGKAGRYRQPAHGVEYRSLGNFWLRTPELVELVFDICEFTLNFVEQGRHLEYWTVDFDRLKNDDAWNEVDFSPADCYNCYGYDVLGMRFAIDEMDKKCGRKYFKMCEELMPTSLFSKILNFTEPSFYEGFYKAWRLRK